MGMQLTVRGIVFLGKRRADWRDWERRRPTLMGVGLWDGLNQKVFKARIRAERHRWGSSEGAGRCRGDRGARSGP